MAEQLTPAQALAVENRGGRLLVSAAAGSGKTKVLVDRLMASLTDPVNPAQLDEFLIITYTRAAAGELRAKIAKKLTERIAQEPENSRLQKQLQRLYLTKISTVHGFCGDLLREYAYRLDLEADFRVADEDGARELRQQAMEQMLERAYNTLLEDPDFCAFTESQNLGRSDKQLGEIIEKVYASARCNKDPEKWLDDCLRHSESLPEDVGETVWGRALMDSLFTWLDSYIPALERCVQTAKDMEKVRANLEALLSGAKYLRESQNWDQVVLRIRIDFGRLSFPKKDVDEDAKALIKAVREGFKTELANRAKVFGRSSSEIAADFDLCAQAQRGLVKLVRQFSVEYEKLKKQRHVLDFSDLEHRTLDLLLGKDRSAPTAVAVEVGRRFREVLVDEYQDSNGVQDAIFDSLTRERQNCFLVGDVKQSIYQFRQADPGIFLEKYNAYGPAETARPGQGRRVLLSHNFRSGPEIVEAVNHVFSHCMTKAVGGLDYGPDEALQEGVPREKLPDPAAELWVLTGARDSKAGEANFVAKRVRQMLESGAPIRGNKGLRPVAAGDIVLLMRSPSSRAAAFQQALEKQGIPCRTDAGVDILASPEVSTLQSLLQTVSNPRQDIPLLGCLASPLFGFTAEDLGQIRAGSREERLFDAMLESDSPKVRAFLGLLDRLRSVARMGTLTELLELIFVETDLESIYGAGPQGSAAKENLRQFYLLAASFEQGQLCTLERFLEHLDRAAEKGLSRAAAKDENAVTIMSIHQSKGLEFPVVFLVDLSHRFNMIDAGEQLLCHKDLGLGVQMADPDRRIRYPSLEKLAIADRIRQETVSEEMRVLYVAMTRPKDRLVMTYAVPNANGPKAIDTLAAPLPMRGMEALCREAQCMGHWILLAALDRPEAGQLRDLAQTHEIAPSDGFPWTIRVVPAEAETEQSEKKTTEQPQPLPEQTLETIRQALAFAYAHPQAAQAPSKQTATARKGRDKDKEAAQDAPEERQIQMVWRSPGFLEGTRDGRAYGSAMHRAMQYLHFEACGDKKSVRQEIDRLVAEEFLTEEEGKLVNCTQIARFFESDIGWKLRLGGQLLREFKFSILDDGCHYGAGLEGEQVLLQGVVDCAIVEEDGITVLDFKTDRVTPDTLPQAVDRYRTQVQTYKEALERIYEKKVKKALLYFFHLDQFVEL